MRIFIELFYHTKCFIRAPVSGYEPYGLLGDSEMMCDERDDRYIRRIPLSFFFYVGLKFPRRRFGEPLSSGFRFDFHSYQHNSTLACTSPSIPLPQACVLPLRQEYPPWTRLEEDRA